MRLDPELLELLACPSCHSPLEEAANELACTGCELVYPIEDGVPVLLIDRARSQPTSQD